MSASYVTQVPSPIYPNTFHFFTKMNKIVAYSSLLPKMEVRVHSHHLYILSSASTHLPSEFLYPTEVMSDIFVCLFVILTQARFI